MRDPVRVYHPDIDQYAVVPAKTVPIRERKGWSVVDDDTTSSDPEESTPPLWGSSTEIPEQGEE